MNFEKPDRLPLWEFMGYWPETFDRFLAEGYPADVDLCDYFGYDRCQAVPVDFNPYPAFETEVLAEDEETRTVRDVTGVIKKEFKYGSAMPHYIEFPIKERKDFLAFAERLDGKSPERYPANWDALVAEYKKRDHPINLVTRGLLALGRDFMEFNDLMMAFMDEPEWVEEMMDFHTQFIMDMWEKALSEVEIDFILFGEDMAFKNGPMISPTLVKQLMIPRYRKLADFFKAHGVNIFIVDSDGDIRSLVPLYLEGGVTGVLPIENTANCCPIAFRQQYPRLQMIGGFDKQKIAKGGEVMEREVRSKMEAIGGQMGWIPGFDHSVHPDTSLAVYQEYLALLRELGEKVCK